MTGPQIGKEKLLYSEQGARRQEETEAQIPQTLKATHQRSQASPRFDHTTHTLPNAVIRAMSLHRQQMHGVGPQTQPFSIACLLRFPRASFEHIFDTVIIVDTTPCDCPEAPSACTKHQRTVTHRGSIIKHGNAGGHPHSNLATTSACLQYLSQRRTNAPAYMKCCESL